MCSRRILMEEREEGEVLEREVLLPPEEAVLLEDPRLPEVALQEEDPQLPEEEAPDRAQAQRSLPHPEVPRLQLPQLLPRRLKNFDAKRCMILMRRIPMSSPSLLGPLSR